MNLIELLGQLDDLGIDLHLEGDRLRFHPAAAMPAELLEELRLQKSEVVAHFKLLAEAPGLLRVILPEAPAPNRTESDTTKKGSGDGACTVTKRR